VTYITFYGFGKSYLGKFLGSAPPVCFPRYRNTIHRNFSDMIAHISKSETLQPDMVIGYGTVGFGCGLEHLRFLNEGDVVELEIDKIGVI
jgi:hypothetical protein